MLGFGLFSLFASRRVVIGGASLAGAGALGTLVVAFTTVQRLNFKEKVDIWVFIHQYPTFRKHSLEHFIWYGSLLSLYYLV